MTNYLTKTQAQIEKETTPKKECYYFGEIHPHIFTPWDDEKSKGSIIYILITHLGKYELDINVFKKAKCPVCGKEEVVVYSLSASVLNGANVLKGYCTNCNELIAFEDSNYYHTIRDYIMENKDTLQNLDPKASKSDIIIV